MSEDSLVLHRTYEAPRERVFAAWTDAKQLERWYTPDITAPVVIASLDFQVGGGYRVEFGAAAGDAPYIETGSYLVIAPPSQLVFTTVLEKDGTILAETHCTLEFIDRGARTDLVMTETGYPGEVKEDRRAGWGRTLDNLVGALGA